MKRIIVIGAGASGMTAAISAARFGASVTVLEGGEKPGKKLLLTGSGRCNLTNLHQSAECYRGADPAFVSRVLAQLPVQETLAFFKEIGLLTYDREGYVYPVSNQASSVLEVLLQELERCRVKVKCREKAEEIRRENGVFFVRTPSWTYEADAVVLSAGSKAACATGSDGSGYALAAGCGHTVLPVLPALAPLKLKETWIRKFSGLRMPASLQMRIARPGRETEAYRESGEVQWTDYGISGIAVFQLSRYAASALQEKKEVQLTLDLLPAYTEDALREHLVRRAGLCRASQLLSGVFAKKAAAALLSQAQIPPEMRAQDLKEEDLTRLLGLIKALTLHVSGVLPFEQAQACQGGVDTREVCGDTLESLRMPGLYLTGELLNVDGICGGYNLQWAWSSGYAAGRHCAAP